jgi:RNA polymerase sigma-70 factor (ECF subfamily)
LIVPRAVLKGDIGPQIFCYARNLKAVAVSNLHVRTRPGGAAQGMSDLAQTLPWGQDEAVLVTELQAGSDAAFEWLVTYYHAGVYNLVYGILSDAADAADVTQEVFLRAFRGIRGFRRGSSLKTWLYRISVRQALNHRRWCWRHHRQQISIDADEDGSGCTLDLRGAEPTPFEQFASHEMQATVRKALADVPALFRSAVILRDLEGLSYEEVAEVLEVSVGTVKSRILRGRRMLKEILDPVLRAVKSEAAVESEKQIPHPAQTAGIRDDEVVRDGAGAREVNGAREIRDSEVSIAAHDVLFAAAKAHGDSR